MRDTKERILTTALHLFARDGYEAVSVSAIAGELGMTKGALYKHYRNKRDIFDSVVARMEQGDAVQAERYGVPEGTRDEMEEAYRNASLDAVVNFAKAQFRYWTENDFSASFRKMLTLEQFRSGEIMRLYQQYLVSGPLNYMVDLFAAMGIPEPRREAIRFYAPMFLFYSVYDSAEVKETALSAMDEYLETARNHLKEWMGKEREDMNRTGIVIRRETEKDYRAVENLVREAFWNVYRPGCSEHYVLHRLRDDAAFVPELDFVMEKDGVLIGQNVFVRAHIQSDDGREIPIMAMGPICIAPEYKRQGYGKRLLDYSVEKAAAFGCGALCFEGNIDFYGKSGFTFASRFGLRYHDLPEDADASFFLCRELIPGYLDGVTGVYTPPEGYFSAEREPEAFAQFDAQFPPKEKQKLPGQLFDA